MIRQLAQCPYCQGCEIALDDQPQVLFNPETDNPNPCVHLIRVEGRFSQWARSPIGVSRVVGSVEFRWDRPGLAAVSRDNHLPEYLEELLNAGSNWAFAPAEPFAIAELCAEQMATDAKGRESPLWEVDGEALFALDPVTFLAVLPACQDQHLATLTIGQNQQR